MFIGISRRLLALLTSCSVLHGLVELVLARNGSRQEDRSRCRHLPYVSLAEARNIAFQYRKVSKAGQDPRVNRGCPTFADALETVIALHSRTWKPGGGSEQQWRSELGKHAIPRLGQKRVDEITTSDVMAVLTTDHLWTRRPTIAKRVRQRIGAVMKWAIAQGHRGDNGRGCHWGGAPKAQRAPVRGV